eukprot:SAG11_NODE_11138_length_781_cov_1.400293_1_plen_136_part_01
MRFFRKTAGAEDWVQLMCEKLAQKCGVDPRDTPISTQSIVDSVTPATSSELAVDHVHNQWAVHRDHRIVAEDTASAALLVRHIACLHATIASLANPWPETLLQMAHHDAMELVDVQREARLLHSELDHKFFELQAM